MENRTRFIVVIGMTLIIGILIGTAGTALYAQKRLSSVVESPEGRLGFIMGRISRALELSEEQKVVVRREMVDFLERTADRRAAFHASIRDETDATVTRIKSVLDDGQIDRAKALFEDFYPLFQPDSN